MAKLVFCGACQKQLDASATLCPHCGAPREPGRRYKDRITAGLLAIFLGAFGVHRFYLGQWWGLFYLLFFWLAIPGFVALVEGIVFLCMPQERWDDKYNGGIRTQTASSRVGLIIVLAAVAFIGIVFLGILAAIAIPAYADYTARSKVANALATAQYAANAVQAHVDDTGAIPSTLVEAGFEATVPPDVRSIELDTTSGDVIVTMSGSPFDGTAFALRAVRDGERIVEWRCSPVDIRERYLPQSCRQPRD